MNIDRLRYVNDSLGHEAGDYILSVIAKRLKDDSKRINILLADFQVMSLHCLLLDIRDAQHAEQLTQEVQQYLEEPIEVMGQMHIPSLSFGIALCPEHAKKPSELAMKAEKALSMARVAWRRRM